MLPPIKFIFQDLNNYLIIIEISCYSIEDAMELLSKTVKNTDDFKLIKKLIQ